MWRQRKSSFTMLDMLMQGLKEVAVINLWYYNTYIAHRCKHMRLHPSSVCSLCHHTDLASAKNPVPSLLQLVPQTTCG